MILTQHFDSAEFERSATADALGIDNRLPLDVIPALVNLCQKVLEPLRMHVGKPIRISSGYRCPELNKRVGGTPHSQHLTGEAADIPVTLDIAQQWMVWLDRNTDFDQCILETTDGAHFWLHLSCRYSGTNRHQIKTKRL